MKKKKNKVIRFQLALLFWLGVVLIIIQTIVDSNDSHNYIPVFLILVSFLPYIESLEIFGNKVITNKNIQALLSSNSDDDSEDISSAIDDVLYLLKMKKDKDLVKKVFNVLRDPKFKFRTTKGIHKGTAGLDLLQVDELLQKLLNHGFVLQAYSEEKGDLWALTSKGKKVKID